MNMVINDLPWVIINLLDEQFAVSANASMANSKRIKGKGIKKIFS